MFDWKETIITGGSGDFVYPTNPKIGSEVSIKLKIYKDNPINYIFLRIAPNGEEINIEMKKTYEDEFFSWYQASITILTKVTNYRFGIVTQNEFFWFTNELRLLKATPSDVHDFKLIADFEDPKWITDSIFYQIFPDRFYDGNPSNNVKTGEYVLHGKQSVARDWNDTVRRQDDYPSLDFYGGDLEGIRQKITYLKELGINSIYLNPIFYAPSNHKYDIMDYKKVDKHFGSNEEFASLVDELHKNGIRIILDGIFNHTGEGHRWFNKLNLFEEKNGAYNTPESPYHDFYTFTKWPEEYESWMGSKSLPKLNYKSEKLKQEIYKNEDSVIKFWLTKPYDIDGWRIDVANMLARQDETQLFNTVWEEIRAETKKCKPEAYLLGEHFFDGSPLLDGEKLDAIMNYQGFNFPLVKWLTKKEVIFISVKKQREKNSLSILFDAHDFKNQLNNFRSILPFQIQLLNFNLLGSHDLPRFLTRLDGNVSLYKIAIIFLFTYIGVPSIYYGDEIGLQGTFDPDNRKPMIWNQDKWNMEIVHFYKSLVALRKSREELKKGVVKEIYCQDEIFSFARILNIKKTVIVLNNNPIKQKIQLPVWKIGLRNQNVSDYLSKKVLEVKNGILELDLQNRECVILSEIF